MQESLSLRALPNIPTIVDGDDLAAILGATLERLDPQPVSGDILVVTHKVVSKAEGRTVNLKTVVPSALAQSLSRETGKPPALCEVILNESRSIVRTRPGLIIAEHRLGLILANAGVDRSNVENSENDERVLLLPEDPDGSAAVLAEDLSSRLGVSLAVIISDSAGRAWRRGVVGLAIGSAKIPAVLDLRGRQDRAGRLLAVTEVGLADEIASAAELLMGEADEGMPAVLISGLHIDGPDRPARDLVRPTNEDLFR